jgi:RNA polymerase sigma factor (TIGR02999 family)
MSDVPSILQRIGDGDSLATNELLPLVYAELKRMASRQLVNELPGQSLQTTALVHEAYLRLVGSDQNWESRGHFFAAAAEAMRRILVDRARSKQRLKRGGQYDREVLGDDHPSKGPNPEEVVLVSDLLDSLAETHPQAADIVKLHYFAGLNISEAGNALGINGTAAHRSWVFAKAWLHRAMKKGDN